VHAALNEFLIDVSPVGGTQVFDREVAAVVGHPRVTRGEEGVEETDVAFGAPPDNDRDIDVHPLARAIDRLDVLEGHPTVTSSASATGHDLVDRARLHRSHSQDPGEEQHRNDHHEYLERANDRGVGG